MTADVLQPGVLDGRHQSSWPSVDNLERGTNVLLNPNFEHIFHDLEFHLFFKINVINYAATRAGASLYLNKTHKFSKK